jgi:tol-pal system protein YbgF
VARRREAPPLAAAAAASTPPLAAAAARGPARPAPAVPERAPASSPSRAAAEAPPALGKLSALQLYQQSLEHLRAGRHEEALVGFRAFIVRFPEHDYADNAQYWIGECHYDRKDFAVAAREFRRVVERFPAGNKVPDALLKAGFSLVAVGEGAAARKTLEELVRAFPQHDAAGLATAKLNELAQRGPAAAALRPAAEEVR